MSFSDYLEDEVLDHIFGKGTTDFVSPPNLFFALFSVAPNDAGGGTELTGNGYARQSITLGASSGGTKSNTNAPAFTASGADWSAAIHGAVFDAATGGNMLDHSAVTSVIVTDGSTLTYAAGTISVSLD